MSSRKPRLRPGHKRQIQLLNMPSRGHRQILWQNRRKIQLLPSWLTKRQRLRLQHKRRIQLLLKSLTGGHRPKPTGLPPQQVLMPWLAGSSSPCSAGHPGAPAWLDSPRTRLMLPVPCGIPGTAAAPSGHSVLSVAHQRSGDGWHCHPTVGHGSLR